MATDDDSLRETDDDLTEDSFRSSGAPNGQVIKHHRSLS